MKLVDFAEDLFWYSVFCFLLVWVSSCQEVTSPVSPAVEVIAWSLTVEQCDLPVGFTDASGTLPDPFVCLTLEGDTKCWNTMINTLSAAFGANIEGEGDQLLTVDLFEDEEGEEDVLLFEWNIEGIPELLSQGVEEFYMSDPRRSDLGCWFEIEKIDP